MLIRRQANTVCFSCRVLNRSLSFSFKKKENSIKNLAKVEKKEGYFLLDYSSMYFFSKKSYPFLKGAFLISLFEKTFKEDCQAKKKGP